MEYHIQEWLEMEYHTLLEFNTILGKEGKRNGELNNVL